MLIHHTVTHQSASPSWMRRHSRHRIWLRDVYPYVFCQKYKKRHQIKNNGEFEIYFVNEEGKLFLLWLLARAAVLIFNSSRCI